MYIDFYEGFRNPAPEFKLHEISTASINQQIIFKIKEKGNAEIIYRQNLHKSSGITACIS